MSTETKNVNREDNLAVFLLEKFRPLLLPKWADLPRRDDGMLKMLAGDAADFDEPHVPQWLRTAKQAKLRLGTDVFFAKHEKMMNRKAQEYVQIDSAVLRLHAGFESVRFVIGMVVLANPKSVEPALANLVACYEDVFVERSNQMSVIDDYDDEVSQHYPESVI